MRQFPKISIRQAPALDRGFTIIEVVITFIIIGVLTLILVPVIANRAEEAKIASAQSDLQHLADAEERAATDTGYYYRPYALNDSITNPEPNGTHNANAPKDLTQTTTGPNYQYLMDNQYSDNNYYENPELIFIQATSKFDSSSVNLSGDFLTASQTTSLYTKLQSLINNNQVGTVNLNGFNWGGPYINWQRDINQNDWPDDPWGNDYLLFTQHGVIFPPKRISSTQVESPDYSKEFYTTIPANVLNTYAYANLDHYFDRPTFVSLGPDGLPGDGSDPSQQDSTTGKYKGRFGNGDDVVRPFGGN